MAPARRALRATRPHGVLLDVDGTLLDSNEAHARAWVDALAEQGMRLPLREVLRRIGEGGDKLLPQISGVVESSARGQEIVARRKEIFRQHYLPRCRPLPGARGLVERLREDDLTIAVATSASKDEVTALLHAAGVHDLIDVAADSDDADRSKPDPDIVIAAARKTGLATDRLVMIGDTPYDVAAAAKAGIDTIAFRSGGWDDANLGGAIAIYDDAADLLRSYADSPFVRAARHPLSLPRDQNLQRSGAADASVDRSRTR